MFLSCVRLLESTPERPANWNTLISVLRSNTVGEEVLAETEYINIKLSRHSSVGNVQTYVQCVCVCVCVCTCVCQRPEFGTKIFLLI